MSDPMTPYTDKIAALPHDGSLDKINFVQALPLAIRMAMMIDGPICALPPDTRFELEEIQLHAFMRDHWQNRADAVRRCEAMLKVVHAEDTKRQQQRRDAAKALLLRADRITRAPADVWTVGDITPLLREMATFIAFFAGYEEPPQAGQLPSAEAVSEPEPSKPQMLPVDISTPADVLRMFRAFVIRNCTQWVLGAGDHHHPIWEHVALNVEGDDPTSGPEYAYLRPENRKPLGVLKLEFDDMQSSREADARGG